MCVSCVCPHFRHAYHCSQQTHCDQTYLTLSEVSLGRGKGPHKVLGQIRNLVSMATDSSHRVIIRKMVSPLFLPYFHPILIKLAGNNDMHESPEEFEIRRVSTTIAELAAI